MRRQTPIAHLLYGYLFPHPTASDPPSFSAHLAKNLVPEVRIEVATFYGDLNSAEARYPGLNYCHPPHRMRLGRFKHHRRLFEAFDSLGLTYNEIQDFCCWEGTKWARERYEKDEGIKVVDTTGDEIKPWVDRKHLLSGEETRRHSITRKTDISVVVEDAQPSSLRQPPPIQEEAEEDGEEEEEMSDADVESATMTSPEPEMDVYHEPASEMAAREQHMAELEHRRDQSITQRINQRILAAWEQGQTLPPDIEQYLKEQSERGNADVTRLLSQRRFLAQRFQNALASSHASRAAA